MSNFIPVMLRAGLSERPPVSNVSPLPTRPSTTSLRGVRGGRWRSVIRAGWVPPAAATARNAPIRRRSRKRRSCTVAVTLACSLAIARARSPSCCGPRWFEGVFCRSRARFMAVATTVARCAWRRSPPISVTASSRLGPVGGGLAAVAVEPVLAEHRALDEAAARQLAVERHRVDDERERAGPCARRRPRASRRPPGGRRRVRARRPGRPRRRGVRARRAGAWTTVTWPRAPRISPASISPCERPAEGRIELRRGACEHRRLARP